MRKTIITLSLLAVMPALAVEPGYETNYMSPRAAAGAVSGAAVSTHQTTAVGVVSGGGTGYGGNASTGPATGHGGNAYTGPATATSAPSSATLTINEAASAKAPSRMTIRNVPDLNLSNIAPTAPCLAAVTAGLSLAGGAIGFGGPKEDINCSLRETARSFAALGLTDDAVAVLCASEHAAAAPTCKALKETK